MAAEQKKRSITAELMDTVSKDMRPLQQFWHKFNNDWSWNNAAGLAYNLILSVIPLLIALIGLFGLFLGGLSPVAYNRLTGVIIVTLSAAPASQSIVALALKQLTEQSGWLGAIGVALAIFNGSRLFLFLEGCFDIIYHVRPRTMIAQNVMAVSMVLLFVILIPVMVLASSVPAFVFSLLRQTLLGRLPGSELLFSLGGILSGLVVAYLFFQTIYIVVPNQKISLRHTWPGSVVSAVLLEIYLILFPLYASYFLEGFAATLGLLILLIFFYYFAVILFLGAEINAFAVGVRETPYDLVTMVYMMMRHLPTTNEGIQKAAAIDHQHEEPEKFCILDEAG